MGVSKTQKDFLLLYFGGGVAAESIISNSIAKHIADSLIWNNVGDWARRAKIVLHGSNFGRNASIAQKKCSDCCGEYVTPCNYCYKQSYNDRIVCTPRRRRRRYPRFGGGQHK